VLTRQARGGRSRGPAEDCRLLSLLGLYAADLWATLRAATEGGLPSLGRQRRPCQPRLHLLSNSNSCLTNSKTTHTCRAQSAALDQAAHMGARTRTPVLGSPRIPTRDARPLGTRAAEAWHAALARSKCCLVALPRLRKAGWFVTNPRAPREAAWAAFAPPATDLQSKPFLLEKCRVSVTAPLVIKAEEHRALTCRPRSGSLHGPAVHPEGARVSGCLAPQ
jgi:hypothetical protein